MPSRGEVLVAILNNLLDFAVVRDQHWYRIPVSSVDKWLRGRWPPQWLAFYQTKVFGDEAHAVNYYARVLGVRRRHRWELFPDQPRDERSQRRYFQLILEPLRRLPRPILSRRWRRIVFIPTTWNKFIGAAEINDLYDESPLEDRLWTGLKQRQIPAERQEFVQVKDRSYALDFAIYCVSGKIDVETDGDTWHADPERIPMDNLRDNDLETMGWRVLRFNTPHIHHEMDEYCLPTIVENINRLDGLDEGRLVPRHINLDTPGGLQQLGLFDDLARE
jgi:very-short-patch-repair endonuclease